MTNREIENAVEKLSPADLAAFRQWFAEFDAANWNKQFKDDVAAGRLDHVAHEALRDVRSGPYNDLPGHPQ